MDNFIIKEAVPEDASAMLQYSKKIGSETENLSFGAEGLPFSIEDEADYFKSILNDNKSCSFIAWKNYGKCKFKRIAKENEPSGRVGAYSSQIRME